MNADQPQHEPVPQAGNGEAPTLVAHDEHATVAPGPVSPATSVGEPVRCLGEYEILSEIARGGMGVVYKARQVKLNRIVALKMILGARLAGKDEVQRFRVEAEAAAKLDHPGIVPIIDIGEYEGQHYYSMNYVEGESLEKMLRGGPLPPRRAAELMREIALAIAHAHERGVIHRDLKPGNVLLDSLGQPRVTDFGLARKVTQDNRLTATGQVLGTPAYMPPEQAAGRLAEVGPLSDVYSLGALLYELLTGVPPFRGANPMETLLQVLQEYPEPPRRLREEIPRDLELICLRCLEKHPLRRYPSALEVANDLQRFLAGESIRGVESGFLSQLAGMVERVQLHEQFAGYGSLLLALAPVMLLPEIWVTLAIWYNWPGALLALGQFSRVAMFLGALAWFRGRTGLLPGNAAERNLWAVWGGYLLACFLYGLGRRVTLGFEDVQIEKEIYQAWAGLTAVAFFSLSTQFWGWCSVIACGFLLLIFVMGFNLYLAPLEFGTAWAVVLVLLGLRLRKLSRTIG